MTAWSKKLTPTQRRYSTTDREWLAVVECVSRVWKHWLIGKEFEVLTDHAPLRQLLTRKGEEFTSRQLRWYERLEPFVFTVTYIKGANNVVPDALSRTPSFYEVNALELGRAGPGAILDAELEEAARQDDRYQAVLADTELQRRLGLTKEGGLLKTLQGQRCVPHDKVLRFKLALEGHEPPLAGHFGIRRTLRQVAFHWWWPRMIRTIEEVVKNCTVCQGDAVPREKNKGPLRNLTAASPWEVVTIDFLSGFAPAPRTRHTACCVVCDRFSRMIHIEPYKDHATARDAVGLVLRMIISRHGYPRIIISDRGTQFDSELWHLLWAAFGTRVALATTHHPQTNGLTERMNRTLISLIRKYVHKYPTRWVEYLPLFEFAYNGAVHSVTCVTPFEADRGYLPAVPASILSTQRQLAEPSPGHIQTHVEGLKRAASDIRELVQQSEAKGWQAVAARENKRRGNPVYQMGDEVLVYWIPFRAYNEELRKHRLRYIGPFTVRSVPNEDVVELEGLPARMPRNINVQYVHLYRRDDAAWKAALRDAPKLPQPQSAGRDEPPSTGGR